MGKLWRLLGLAGVVGVIGCSALTNLDELRGTGEGGDAALPDRGTTEGGVNEAGVVDQRVEAGNAEAGAAEAGAMEAGTPDRGLDTGSEAGGDGPVGPKTTFYVSKTGKDSASCGPKTDPCASIFKALSLAKKGDAVVVRNGTYNDTTEFFPVELKPGVSLTGEGGSGQVGLNGTPPLITCGTSATRDLTGTTVTGFKLLATATGSSIYCGKVKGTPRFDDIRVQKAGVMVDGSAPYFYDLVCAGVETACFTVKSVASGTALPTLRKATLSSNLSCVEIEQAGNIDMGTTPSPGGNKFSACNKAALCNKSKNAIDAKKNTWLKSQYPPSVGSTCDGTTQIGNTNKGSVNF